MTLSMKSYIFLITNIRACFKHLCKNTVYMYFIAMFWCTDMGIRFWSVMNRDVLVANIYYVLKFN